MCSGVIGRCLTWTPSGRSASFTAVQIVPPLGYRKRQPK